MYHNCLRSNCWAVVAMILKVLCLLSHLVQPTVHLVWLPLTRIEVTLVVGCSSHTILATCSRYFISIFSIPAKDIDCTAIIIDYLRVIKWLLGPFPSATTCTRAVLLLHLSFTIPTVVRCNFATSYYTTSKSTVIMLALCRSIPHDYIPFTCLFCYSCGLLQSNNF